MPRKSFDEVEEELTLYYGQEAKLISQIKAERGQLAYLKEELEQVRGKIARLEKIKKQKRWDA